VSTLLDQFHSHILEFAEKHLEFAEPGDDCIENFFNYLLLFLRGVPARVIQMPVPMHRAH